MKVLHSPLSPDIKLHNSPNCSPYISHGTNKENLSAYQEMLSLVISSFIIIA